MNTTSLTNIDLSGVPNLYATEDIALDDKFVYVKLFTPWSNWTWYIMESDGENQCFGFVKGYEDEFGYFSLRELEAIKGPFGLKVEKDKFFQPKPFKEL